MTQHALEQAAPTPATPARAALAPLRSLEVGSADDALEHAADRVANRVLRRCACGGVAGPDGECARCRAARLAGRSGAPPAVHEALRMPGAPLDATSRTFFETRLGADLSAVRVHHDGAAASSADAVDAVAYTVGSDIVFGANRYQPGTGPGRRLLAHELAHVLQQRSGTVLLQRQTSPTCNTVKYDPDTEQCCNDLVIPGPGVVGGPTCPNLTTRDIEYDGCSVPDWLLAAGQDKDNPAGFADTEFSDKRIHGHWNRSFQPEEPCDVHDKCFQTCGTDVRDCDRQLIWDAQAVCRNAKLGLADYQYCLAIVADAEKKLALGSWKVHIQRQREYCVCCGGTPSPVVSKVTATVEFATGSSKLDKAADLVLDEFVVAHRILLAGVNYDLTLVGQASRLGHDPDNFDLSKARLAKVRAGIETRLGMALAGNVLEQPLGAALAAVEVPTNPTDDSQEYRSVQIILVGPK